jgi:hypothetical protein
MALNRPLSDVEQAGFWQLHCGTSSAIATVIPDRQHPDLFRINWPSGETSDIANLTRAKDAAEIAAERGPPPRNRRDLRWKQAGQRSASPPMRQNGRGVA